MVQFGGNDDGKCAEWRASAHCRRGFGRGGRIGRDSCGLVSFSVAAAIGRGRCVRAASTGGLFGIAVMAEQPVPEGVRTRWSTVGSPVILLLPICRGFVVADRTHLVRT